jgi:hypothetical protein
LRGVLERVRRGTRCHPVIGQPVAEAQAARRTRSR